VRLRQLTYGGYPQRIFVSGHTRGLPAAATRHRLAESGITHVFCVAPTPDWDLEISMDQGFYHHHPLPDGKEIGKDQVRTVVEQIYRVLMDTTDSVLVHCRAGRNRSCLVAALVLIKFHQDPKTVLAELRHVRPRALANPLFEKIVTEDWRDYI